MIADIVFVFKCLRNQMAIKHDGIGLVLSSKNERNSKAHFLQLRHKNYLSHALFM